MGAQQGLRLTIADLEVMLEHAHQYAATDARRTGRIAAVVDPYASVVVDGTLGFDEILEALQWQRLQERTFLLKHGFDLAFRAAVNALRRPVGFPMFEEVVLLLDRGETPALERRTLGMLYGIFHGTFAIGIPDTRRVSHHAVMCEHGGVDRVQLRFVQVRLDDPFLQVIENHIATTATEISPGLLVQAGPGFLTGFPHHAPKAAP